MLTVKAALLPTMGTTACPEFLLNLREEARSVLPISAQMPNLEAAAIL